MVVVGIVGPPKSGKKTAASFLSNLYNAEIIIINKNKNKYFYFYDKKIHQIDDHNTETSSGVCTPQNGTATAAAAAAAAEAANASAAAAAASDAADAADAVVIHTEGAAAVEDEGEEAAAAAMNYCMQNWEKNFILLGIKTPQQLQICRKRPIFLLIALNAPILIRMQRARNEDLTTFLKKEDEVMFGSNTEGGGDGMSACIRQADIHIWGGGTIQQLQEKLQIADVLNPERRRPSWDSYFIRLASLAASRANCLKRRVGAIVVRSNRLISTGYNGTHSSAVNCLDGGCKRCKDLSIKAGQLLHLCSCIHAEANALLEAGRDRCLGASLYVTCLPCLGCAKLAIQAGIKCVVYAEEYDINSGSLQLFTDAGIEVYKFSDRHPSIPHAISPYAQ